MRPTPNHALQRTAPAVTLAAPPPSPAQPSRQPPPSLSLGSLGLMSSSFAFVLVFLFTSTTFARSPLAILREPERFDDDKAAKQADLSYRVSIRPFKWPPVVMKLYVTFDRPLAPGGMRMRGRFVMVAIRDGTNDKLFTNETSLGHSQVVALLRCIQDQEIFNLIPSPLSTPERIADSGIIGMDPTNWCFERFQSPAAPISAIPPRYSVVWRVSCDHGPAHEVYSAFSRHALKLLPKGNNQRKSP